MSQGAMVGRSRQDTDKKSTLEPGTNVFIRVHEWSAFGFLRSKARFVNQTKKGGILVSFQRGLI